MFPPHLPPPSRPPPPPFAASPPRCPPLPSFRLRRWTQKNSSDLRAVESGYRTAGASGLYPLAGVCEVGGACHVAGYTAAVRPGHFAGDATACSMCDPLKDQGALSALSYPKTCYLRSDLCDLDVSCDIEAKTCPNDAYLRPEGVVCRPPPWDQALYGAADLAPYEEPWNFPRNGLWEHWTPGWELDRSRDLYYVNVSGSVPGTPAFLMESGLLHIFIAPNCQTHAPFDPRGEEIRSHAPSRARSNRGLMSVGALAIPCAYELHKFSRPPPRNTPARHCLCTECRPSARVQ